jgi:hypothetical protein
MAITTLAEQQAALGNWLTRSDLSSRLPEFNVLFEAWANRRLRVRQMETSTSLTPSSGVATLPTDMLELRCVTWTGTPRAVLEYVTPQAFDATDPDRPSDTPKRYTVQGSSLKVMPISNTVLEVDYYQKIPALSTGNQAAHWLFNSHTDLYLAGPLHEAYTVIKDVEKAMLWMQKRDMIVAEILELDKAAQWGRGPLAIRIAGSPVV